MPVLDKGHQITFLKSDFDISRFKLFCVQRKKHDLYGASFEGFSDYELAYFERLFSRRKNNLRSVKKRIDKCVLHDHLEYCYFLTLTFSEDYLSKTSAAYRRDQISRFLKSNFANYVANVDYGDENEREHYHALVFLDYELECFLSRSDTGKVYFKYPSIDYQYGYFKVQPVLKPCDDKTKLSKYMIKLKYHSSKDSTKFSKPIYSRRKVV